MATAQLLSAAIVRLAPNPPVWSAQQPSVVPVLALNKVFATLFNGLYRVTGTLAVAGPPDVPVARKGRLIDTKSGRIAREVWSDVAGNYSFDYVAYGPWTVLFHDHTGTYNAVVADNRLGERM